MKNQEQTFLKVTSILMVIGGIIALLAGVFAILGVSALAALMGSAEGTGLLYAGSVLAVVTSAVEILAGAKGLKACRLPGKAGECVILGIAIVALSMISMAVNVKGGGEFKIINLVVNLLVPVLYILGAVKTKPAARA
ncbi:hypothetical protein ACTQZS_09105 [Bilifractor sp. LCP19S3_H10]|uniref:hypothetical protein n=1 Tax=Bilifractor sp. LCP19S3_H10 TaxID=3438736 RepID=UPI003F92381A